MIIYIHVKYSLFLYLYAAKVQSAMSNFHFEIFASFVLVRGVGIMGVICFHFQVDELLKNLHTKLTQIQFAMTKTGTLRTLRTLACHHLSPFLTSLLQYPVPYSRWMFLLITDYLLSVSVPEITVTLFFATQQVNVCVDSTLLATCLHSWLLQHVPPVSIPEITVTLSCALQQVNDLVD